MVYNMYILRKDGTYCSPRISLHSILYNAYILHKVGYFLNKKNFFWSLSGTVPVVCSPYLSTLRRFIEFSEGS